MGNLLRRKFSRIRKRSARNLLPISLQHLLPSLLLLRVSARDVKSISGFSCHRYGKLEKHCIPQPINFLFKGSSAAFWALDVESEQTCRTRTTSARASCRLAPTCTQTIPLFSCLRIILQSCVILLCHLRWSRGCPGSSLCRETSAGGVAESNSEMLVAQEGEGDCSTHSCDDRFPADRRNRREVYQEDIYRHVQAHRRSLLERSSQKVRECSVKLLCYNKRHHRAAR